MGRGVTPTRALPTWASDCPWRGGGDSHWPQRHKADAVCLARGLGVQPPLPEMPPWNACMFCSLKQIPEQGKDFPPPSQASSHAPDRNALSTFRLIEI